MKRFTLMLILIMGLFIGSCGTMNYVNGRTVLETDRISVILSERYPQLFDYYNEGLLDVISVKEITLEDNTIDYDVNYRFVRYYYRTLSEKLFIVEELYPDLYQMYVSGLINITTVYKYVDRNGNVKIHISYSRRGRPYDIIYYDYFYPAYRMRPQRIPPRPRPEPRPKPRPEQRPEPRPDGQPRNPAPRNGSVNPAPNGGQSRLATPNQPQTRPDNPAPKQNNTPTVNRNNGSTRSNSSGNVNRSNSGSATRSSGNSGSVSRSSGNSGNNGNSGGRSNGGGRGR